MKMRQKGSERKVECSKCISRRKFCKNVYAIAKHYINNVAESENSNTFEDGEKFRIYIFEALIRYLQKYLNSERMTMWFGCSIE